MDRPSFPCDGGLGQILPARGGRDVSYPQGAEAVPQFGDEQAGLLEGREVAALGECRTSRRGSRQPVPVTLTTRPPCPRSGNWTP
jgi:hypothetical protein